MHGLSKGMPKIEIFESLDHSIDCIKVKGERCISSQATIPFVWTLLGFKGACLEEKYEAKVTYDNSILTIIV